MCPWNRLLRYSVYVWCCSSWIIGVSIPSWSRRMMELSHALTCVGFWPTAARHDSSASENLSISRYWNKYQAHESTLHISTQSSHSLNQQILERNNSCVNSRRLLLHTNTNARVTLIVSNVRNKIRRKYFSRESNSNWNVVIMINLVLRRYFEESIHAIYTYLRTCKFTRRKYVENETMQVRNK